MPGYVVSACVALWATLSVIRIASGAVGPDPAKWLLHESGFVALVFLVATISVSPVSRALRKPKVVLWRRPLGLAAFFLSSVHLLVYATVYQGLLLSAIFDDLAKRPYILIGVAAWLLLVPLAATSSRRARRRLGDKWIRLHRAVYVIVPLAIAHQAMAQKADLGETLIFSAIAGCFLIERMVRAGK